MLGPSWLQVGSSWPMLAPRWLPLKNHTQDDMPYPPSWPQVGSILAPCWLHVGSMLALCWLMLAPCWLMLGQVASMMAPYGSKLAQVGLKMPKMAFNSQIASIFDQKLLILERHG